MALVRLIVSEIRRYPSLLEKGERRNYPVEVIARFLSAPVMRNRYKIADPHEAASMLLGMVTQDTAFKLMISGCAVPRTACGGAPRPHGRADLPARR